MTTLLHGADSVTVSALPDGLDWYAGYVGGSWPTFSPEVQRFPALAAQGRIVSIAVNAFQKARILDCETGDATPDECGLWLKARMSEGVVLPGIYANASTMPAVINDCHVQGVDMSKIVLWVAQWDGIASVPPAFQAKQYIDHGPQGQNYDQNVALESFFPGSDPPQENGIHYDWFLKVRLFGKLIDEEKVARSYDHYRRMMLPHSKPRKAQLALYPLRFLCRNLAKRIDNVAHRPGQSYRTDHRGYRRAELWARAQGARVTR
jgi:hypothetical protein